MAAPATRAAGANGALRRLPVGLVYVLGLLPAAWLFWLGLTGGLGPDPVKALEHRYGEIALQLMVAVLAVSPLRRFTGVSLIRFRRALGLLAFAYVTMHLLVWAVLDVQLDWAGIVKDVLERPYITIGMAGFLMLVPLAVTSNDTALRRMGAVAWRRLHLLTYPAALAGALHHLLLTKTWELEPALYLGAILLLLLLRLPALQPARGSRAG
jgi:sulfoxide reductase heme-binding subunit YedZ